MSDDPREPSLADEFEEHVAWGKPMQQVLICVLTNRDRILAALRKAETE